MIRSWVIDVVDAVKCYLPLEPQWNKEWCCTETHTLAGKLSWVTIADWDEVCLRIFEWVISAGHSIDYWF